MCDHCIASVVIRLLSIQISPKTAPNSLRPSFPADLSPPRVPTRSNIPPDPSLFLMAGPCCVLSSEGPSLSPPAPRFCCSNVLSAPHITSEPPKLRTDTFSRAKNLRRGSGEAFTKRRWRKRQHLEKRKRDQDVIIPRSVSTFVAGEEKKKQPPLSDSVFIAYIRPVSVCPYTNTRLERYSSKIRSG